jgi:hypothetical protein
MNLLEKDILLTSSNLPIRKFTTRKGTAPCPRIYERKL